ncbi:hypothetical protein CR513_42362, partial [Mucuna pruriens]
MGKCGCLVSLVVALVLMMSLAEAQSDSSTSCASSLTTCAQYLSSNTTPPSSCCDPIKQTVANDLACLCKVYASGVLQSFNVSIDQALALSRRCGITSDLSSCKNGSAPSPASGAPPATPGGDKGGAGRVTFTGLSFILLFWKLLIQLSKK